MTRLGRPVGALGPRILRGMELSLLAQAAGFAVALAATPALLRALGPEGYAVYAFLWVILGYSTLLNLGTIVAVQRYTADRRGRGLGAGGILAWTLRLQLATSALGALAILAGGRWIAYSFLNVDGPALEATSRAVSWMALSIPPYFITTFAANVLYGQERFAGYNLFLTAPQLAATAVAAALARWGGWGIGPLVLATAAVHWTFAAAGLWAVRADVAGGPVDAREAREFVRFSARSLATQMVWQLKFQGDRLFIGRLLPLAQFTYYAIPASIAQKFNALYGIVNTATFPMMTELHARGERERLKRLYLKATELMLFLVAPCTALAFVLVPQFLTLWLGAEFSAACTWPFRLLLLANTLYLGTYLSNAAAVGQGAPHLLSYLLGAQSAVLLAFWPWAIARWGILGAAAGLLAAEAVCVPVFLARVHRRFLGVGWGEFLCAGFKPAALAGVLVAAALPFHGRVGSWAGLVSACVAGLALFAAAAYPLVEREDRDLLRDWLKAKLSPGR